MGAALEMGGSPAPGLMPLPAARTPRPEICPEWFSLRTCSAFGSLGSQVPLAGQGVQGALGTPTPQPIAFCCPHYSGGTVLRLDSLLTPDVQGRHRNELCHWLGVLHLNIKCCLARDGARFHRFRAQPHKTVPVSHSQPRLSPVLLADWLKSRGSHNPPSSSPIHRLDGLRICRNALLRSLVWCKR